MRRWLCILGTTICFTACTGAGAGHDAPRAAAIQSPATVVSPAAPPSAPGPIATPPPSDSPAPAAPPALGVLVDLLSDQTTYTITLASADGQIVHQVHAHQRTRMPATLADPIVLPYVSTTLQTMYYLDGDSDVRGIHLDGTPAIAPQLAVEPGMEAAFAVSPDDQRLAVSVLDFNKTPVHLTLYTDTLQGGSRHVIFESDTTYVWPVAWHAGLLVLAHGYGPFETDIAKAAPGRDNPYSAISYHVVNPATANRVVLMGSCTVSGPLSPAGSGCIQGGSIDWQGNTGPWSTQDWGSISAAAALSPEGDWMAATNPDAQTEMGIWRRSDGLLANHVDGVGSQDWVGWLDNETIVVGSYLRPDWQPFVANVVQGGVVHVIAAHGFFAATFPTLVS